ncbi:MAG: hypothetical protein ACI944_002261, partial [Natronomonas sp.]
DEIGTNVCLEVICDFLELGLDRDPCWTLCDRSLGRRPFSPFDRSRCGDCLPSRATM